MSRTKQLNKIISVLRTKIGIVAMDVAHETDIVETGKVLELEDLCDQLTDAIAEFNSL